MECWQRLRGGWIEMNSPAQCEHAVICNGSSEVLRRSSLISSPQLFHRRSAAPHSEEFPLPSRHRLEVKYGTGARKEFYVLRRRASGLLQQFLLRFPHSAHSRSLAREQDLVNANLQPSQPALLPQAWFLPLGASMESASKWMLTKSERDSVGYLRGSSF